jgi:hypothetical protein
MNLVLWQWRKDRQILRNEGNHNRNNTSPSKALRNKKRERIWSHRREARLQLRELFDSAFIDREKSEKVSMMDSVALDVGRGEVLSSPRYHRKFEL